MFLRWLYKSWHYFWTVIFTILLVIIMLTGGLIGLLQMRASKNYIADRIEKEFNKTYNARLKIGRLDGLLPFDVQLSNAVIVREALADSLPPDTLIDIKKVNARIDVWSLLQSKISIKGFSVNEPKVNITTKEGQSFREAFKRKINADSTLSEPEEPWIANIEIVAPQVSIQKGELLIEGAGAGNEEINLPDPLLVKNINSEMFLEISEQQRFWDFESFEADVQNVQSGHITVSGQLYNDDRFLEFNAFNVSAGNSHLSLNGQIDGIDLYKKGLADQLRKAKYNIDISSSGLRLQEFAEEFPDLPDISEPLVFSLDTEGKIDSLWVNDFSFGVGESRFSINGFFENLSDVNRLGYKLKIAEVEMRKKDLEVFTGPLNNKQYKVLEDLTFNGKANGSLDSVNVDLDLRSNYGTVTLQGGSQLKKPYKYSGTLSAKQLNIGPLTLTKPDTTNLNLDATISGMGTDLSNAIMNFDATAYNSTIDEIPVDELDIKASLLSGFLEQEYTYKSGKQRLDGTGWIELTQKDRSFAAKGHAEQINLRTFVNDTLYPATSLNFDYNIELKGTTADRLQGRANLDIKPSVVAGDSVQSHQIYMDLDSPDQQSRSFRLTSSLFDLNITGDLIPSNILAQSRLWGNYLNKRLEEEILLKPQPDSTKQDIHVKPMVLKGNFKAKDLGLLQTYWPEFPDIRTDARFNFNVNADSTRLLLSTDIRGDTLQYNKMAVHKADAQLTASFRRDKKLKEFSNLDVKLGVASLNSEVLNLDSLSVDLTLRQDSLSVTQKVASFSDNAHMNFQAQSVLSDSTIQLAVQKFYIGNNTYAWQNQGTPAITYNSGPKFSFANFSFKNRNEYFELKGALSPGKQDSLLYILRDINLKRISDLINGSVSFDGKANGTLITRTLTETPSVQGNLKINKFMLQDRLIGDVNFNSSYNRDAGRFDTHIAVLTDTTKYSDYLASNDNVGQDIIINGYINTPEKRKEDGMLYNFDVNLKEIDMWVLPLITRHIFNTMEGRADGNGYFRGDLDDFDFHADFQVHNVFAKPRFLNANYFLNGHVVLDRHSGVDIDSVRVSDTKGGTGLLWGNVDLNDFKPITFLDLNFNLNDLQFLNNTYDPDEPFYGNVSGTGKVKLTGPNTDLFLRTTEPVSVSENSRIAIPIAEETQVDESNKFIQFVDSFDVHNKGRISLAKENVRNTTIDEDSLEAAIGNLTFDERFNLDLQFNAPKEVTVDLIFDRLTGEQLSAQGTGQLRISMQDEDMRMFGRYNIDGGTYRFVSGEIISRKLDLQPGGSIVWEGDPENARLDISAVYHARPNVSSLNASIQSQPENIQRVPIDLVIQINGTVSSVENNYFFKLPNTLELSSGSTLGFTINQINRDEQEKFLQATSILLGGEFIPTQNFNQATTALGQNLSRGSTVINPILSNQVISPLLSNQINSLLNSDVSRFDIDFNLNAYNEIDLGIALRLYNDKLILRREGQLTSSSSESSIGDRIGDLNATYRINRSLSLTAFHRQDEVLGTTTPNTKTGDITPSVDGLGLEAKVQFNTWHQLKRKIVNTFRRIFGTYHEEKKGKELTKSSEKPNNKKEQ